MQIQICPTTVVIAVRRRNVGNLSSVQDVKVSDTVQKKCQRHHWVNHKPLYNCIWDLSQYQKVGIKGEGDSSDPDAYPSHLNPKQKTAIAGLVEKKCTLTCKLENENFEVLWDTGAQVSLISEQTVEKYLPYL